MRSQSAEGPSSEAPTTRAHADKKLFPELFPHEPRNLVVLAIHQIVYRIGWIFKTESVIMPAVLDAVAATAGLEKWQAVLRSGLPMLNRFGQSLSPVFFARRLAAMSRKKTALVTTTLLSGLPVLAMALPPFSQPTQGRWWAPILFLALYATFFVLAGLHILSFGTVQGKLIRPTRRGRLLAVAASLGSLAAVGFAWWLMRSWLKMESGGYAALFAFTGSCFLLAGLCAMFVREEPEKPALPSGSSGDPAPAQPSAAVSETSPAFREGHFAGAWRVFRQDANFRRLAVVVFLFCVTMLLFPHYQALARERLQLKDEELVYWVILQNLSVGFFSVFLGPFSDRRGIRAALRWTILLASLAPMAAIGAVWSGPAAGRYMFWAVYVCLGLAPITLRFLSHYVLEVSRVEDHPRYLGTLSLCQAVPFLASPLVGWCITGVGYTAVFLCGAGLVLTGSLLTAWLREPREAAIMEEPAETELP